MTRWPTRATLSLTPGPIAATTPHGSCPPITGFGLTGNPPIASPPDLGRRYWWRSLPHIPEDFISTTTSSGPGVGSGNSIISICRSPVKTTPRIASSAFSKEIKDDQPTPFRAGPVHLGSGKTRSDWNHWRERRSLMGEIDMSDPNDPYDLQRFVDAQNPDFERVCSELRDGRKTSHWMWFIFPQIRGLGSSPLARKFAISSLEEAAAYLDHPVLRPRLI